MKQDVKIERNAIVLATNHLVDQTVSVAGNGVIVKKYVILIAPV